MTPSTLTASLRARKDAIERLWLATLPTIGTPEYVAFHDAYRAAAAHYWRAVVWLPVNH